MLYHLQRSGLSKMDKGPGPERKRRDEQSNLSLLKVGGKKSGFVTFKVQQPTTGALF